MINPNHLEPGQHGTGNFPRLSNLIQKKGGGVKLQYVHVWATHDTVWWHSLRTNTQQVWPIILYLGGHSAAIMCASDAVHGAKIVMLLWASGREGSGGPTATFEYHITHPRMCVLVSARVCVCVCARFLLLTVYTWVWVAALVFWSVFALSERKGFNLTDKRLHTSHVKNSLSHISFCGPCVWAVVLPTVAVNETWNKR